MAALTAATACALAAAAAAGSWTGSSKPSRRKGRPPHDTAVQPPPRVPPAAAAAVGQGRGYVDPALSPLSAGTPERSPRTPSWLPEVVQPPRFGFPPPRTPPPPRRPGKFPTPRAAAPRATPAKKPPKPKPDWGTDWYSSRSPSAPTVALHWSVFGGDANKAGSFGPGGSAEPVLRLMRQLRYCFDELLFTIDTPHGGKDYGNHYRPAPRGEAAGAGAWTASAAGQVMLPRMRESLLAAAALVGERCPHRAAGLATRLEVIDHTAPASRALLRRMFDLTAPTHVWWSPWKDRNPSATPLERMWKNSFSYMYAVHLARTDFLFHSDDDMPDFRPLCPWVPNEVPKCVRRTGYVRQAMGVMMRRPDVVFVFPPSCSCQCSKLCQGRFGCNYYKDGFVMVGNPATNPKYKPRADPTDVRAKLIPFITTQRYMLHVARMRSVWPMPYWTDMIELMLMYALGEKHRLTWYLAHNHSDMCFPAT